MSLPIPPSFEPMDALAQSNLPEGADWVYEPKWDGFRCLVRKDGNKVDLISKNGLSLARYFPEMISHFKSIKSPAFVLDGELIIVRDNKLSFDDLLQRIHPAQSRILKLSNETPASYVMYDILVDEKRKKIFERPFGARRTLLEALHKKYFSKLPQILLSPQTNRLVKARRWITDLRDMLDGVIAKDTRAPYESGKRSGVVQKIKNLRTADCVVGGFRYASKGNEIGSLLLGLYNEAGLLNHVGFVSSFDQKMRQALKAKVEKLIKPPGFTGNTPGGPSRWSTERTAEWKPLATKLVVEVQYDHFTGDRFRHGTRFLRWRPDKSPRQCRLAQVQHETKVLPNAVA